ncbi:MAG: DNA-formamidopyrimidine glycosylase [Ferruginibacter sp.]|nr:DNA-formamidopyrimidine glycosylase [Cytophagales bacterium]
MPELPEVETYRRYFEATSLDQTLLGIDVADHKLLTTDYGTLTQSLIGSRFVRTHRIGKHLFITTDRGQVMVMHFGMSGGLAYFRDQEDTPRFARIVFHFAGGFRLGFLCPRKFERIGLVDSIEGYALAKGLGVDALEVSVENLMAKLSGKKAMVKPLLLDQATVAGIGNWIVDEVLFQAKVHPETRGYQLTEADIRRIHAAIGVVLQTAIHHEAAYGRFPTDFLIHAREWDDSPYADQRAHTRCPRCGNDLRVIRVGGRATYFCPVCQPAVAREAAEPVKANRAQAAG